MTGQANRGADARHRLAPVSADQRIEALDVLRGFALFGILLVNFPVMAAPHARLTVLWPASVWPVLGGLIVFLVAGKFYGLFSLLFGAGFAIQMERSEGSGRFFFRRLIVLLGIGLAHGLLIWAGDILTAYAVLGLLLIPFRKRKDRTLLIWAVALIGVWVSLMLFGHLWVQQAMSRARGREQLAVTAAESEAHVHRRIESAVRAYGRGPYRELFRERASAYARGTASALGATGHFFAMFLLGAWAHRKGLFRDIGQHRFFLTGTAAIGLSLGLCLNLVYVWSMSAGAPGPGNPTGLVGMAAYFSGAPMLTAAYASLVLLALTGPAARLLQVLAPVGRMALTNYLTHSLVGTTIFSFYGFGLYDRIALPWVLLMACAIFGVQIPLSALWLRRFRMGPAEWLWRRLTYGWGSPLRIRR